MATLLRDPKVADFDVLAIQEPWRNPYMATTHHPAKDQFHLCYPADDHAGRSARVCFFVNKRLDHTKWSFESHSRDAGSLKFQIAASEGTNAELAIHNVYNPVQSAENRTSVLPTIRNILQTSPADEQMVLGDFNLHHTMWGGDEVSQSEQEAEELIDIMASSEMTTTLPPGTTTYEEGLARTTIDLCWMSFGLLDRLIQCQVDGILDHDSDHLPISTVLDLRVQQQVVKPVRPWKKLNNENFCKVLKEELPTIQRPRTVAALERYVGDIIDAMVKTADQALPLRQPSQRAREGWTTECSEVLAEAKRLKRRHGRTRTEESWEAYRAARNCKTRTIKKALQKAHRERVEAAASSPESLWRLSKWARNRGSEAPGITPAIRCPHTGREVREVEGKAEIFRAAFFPPPASANLEDIRRAQYTGQVEFPPITEKEVAEAIHATQPMKAPGPDGIPNKALQASASLLAGHLTSIFNQSLKLGHCPTHFRNSTTVVLRKPGKDDYKVPKAYRPIALLNTIGKVMDAVLARRLSWLVETQDVLPNAHMGGRKQRATEHALHAVIERIYAAWNTGQGQVASLLLLDVSGAFDNVSHERLLHNLRSREVDERLVRWIASFLSNRRTRIAMDGSTSEEYSVETGIPQGSPLSPILYIFYNAGLIEQCTVGNGTATTGYIDDAAILAWGDSTNETCQKLAMSLERAQRWATTHASKFAPEKFQLTHFTRARTRHDLTQGIETTWCHIEPKATCKYLGVTMDTKLQWKPHVEEIQRKVTKTVNALGVLGNSRWGVSMLDLRKIYQGTAVPQMMYGCSLWSNARDKGRAYTEQTLRTMRSMQARAARAMSGAFRATSIAALDVETYLLPIERQIERHNSEALIRLVARHNIDDVDATRRLRPAQPRPAKYCSPLQHILRDGREADLDLGAQEHIPAFLTPPWWSGPLTHIDAAETAYTTHELERTAPASICIYTDGARVNGHVGAAAVRHGTGELKSVYMGTEANTTTYAAELQAIGLALDIALAETGSSTSRQQVAIWIDSQAAVRSLTRCEGRTGAYILRQIIRNVETLRLRGHSVVVRWIPAHRGIYGNEAADRAAKEATGWRKDGSTGPQAPTPAEVFACRAATRSRQRRRVQEAWEATWHAETKGRAAYRYTAIPSKAVLRLHAGLSKRQSSLLVQLRTEKIGLRDFLFRRRVPDISNPWCACREGRQTVRHLLLTCKTHRNLRRQEFDGHSGSTDLRTILTKRKLAIKALRFMEQTMILGQNRIAEE